MFTHHDIKSTDTFCCLSWRIEPLSKQVDSLFWTSRSRMLISRIVCHSLWIYLSIHEIHISLTFFLHCKCSIWNINQSIELIYTYWHIINTGVAYRCKHTSNTWCCNIMVYFQVGKWTSMSRVISVCRWAVWIYKNGVHWTFYFINKWFLPI